MRKRSLSAACGVRHRSNRPGWPSPTSESDHRHSNRTAPRGAARNKLVALLLGCVTATLAVSTARAADDSANPYPLKTTEDLYRVCTVPATDPMHTQTIDLCEGFVVGAVSYHDAVSDRRHLKPLICYPASATRDQGVQAFVAWAASHQQDQKFMADPAVIGLVRGLASKWPCSESAK